MIWGGESDEEADEGTGADDADPMRPKTNARTKHATTMIFGI